MLTACATVRMDFERLARKTRLIEPTGGAKVHSPGQTQAVTAAERERLLDLWRREEAPQPTGWDFSALDGRMNTDSPPWDLDAEYRQALAGAQRALDMGTGGGEHLLRFADALPADTTATEGWPPNVPVAREALAHLGIPVVEFGAPDHDPDSTTMPFPTADSTSSSTGTKATPHARSRVSSPPAVCSSRSRWAAASCPSFTS